MLIRDPSLYEWGKDGYTYWSGKPTVPGTHEFKLVPHSVADGWAWWCSCGHWYAFDSFYDHDTKESLLTALRRAQAAHAEGADA